MACHPSQVHDLLAAFRVQGLGRIICVAKPILHDTVQHMGSAPLGRQGHAGGVANGTEYIRAVIEGACDEIDEAKAHLSHAIQCPIREEVG